MEVKLEHELNVLNNVLIPVHEEGIAIVGNETQLVNVPCIEITALTVVGKVTEFKR